MATQKAALRITELDFNSIRENLKTFLQSQEEFQDFDFDGSGMSVLLDMLAYDTHYKAFHLNMAANEMFLDSAQLRASILSHAKLMNYVPASKQGAESRVNITVTPSNTENQNLNVLTLDKYTKFLGLSKNGINYPFVTLHSNTATKDSGSFSFANVVIKQGEVITLQYLVEPTNPKRKFEIASANVDTTTISVRVQDSPTDANTTVYTLADDITELTGNSAVYFLEENEKGTYSLYFGDGYIGKRPTDQNVVICTYLDTVGAPSNNITGFALVDAIGGNFSDNVAISVVNSSAHGIDKETVEQIQFRAPFFYSAQNRAVSKNDYESLILKDYPNLEAVSVWGGEKHVPVTYGKVFMSLKTKGNYFLTNLEKERIKTELVRKRNILTVTPEIIDPDFSYISIKGQVSYNPSKTTRTAGELLQLVRAAISDYNDKELNKFSSVFRKLVLETYILNCEPSITGCNLDIYIKKRISVNTERAKTYDIDFDVPLVYCNDLVTYPSVQIRDSSAIERDIYFEQSTERLTGIDSIVIDAGGQNYITPPTVRITGDGTGATARAKILSGRVVSIEVINKGSNYTQAFVSIEGGEGSGAAASVKLQYNKIKIRSFYFAPTGEKVIVDNNAGYIEYLTGKVYLNTVRIFSVTENDFYDPNIITISGRLRNHVIYPARNKILTIDDNDPRSILVTMVSE